MTDVLDLPSEAEHRKIVDTFREMIEGAFGESAARRAIDGGMFIRSAWQSLAREYALLGLHAPQEAGGQGAAFMYSVLAARAAGAVVLPAPYAVTNHLAVPLLNAAKGNVTARLELAAVLSGERIVAVAGAGSGLAGIGHQLQIANDGTVWGSSAHVQFGSTADVFLVFAADGAAETRLVLVRPDDRGVTVEDHAVVDATRPQSRLSLEGVTGTILTGVTPESLTQGLAEATILLASEAAGGARAALERAITYAKVRHQFGRPVGSFQALQHKLVDLFAEVEAADATVDWAASLVDGGGVAAKDLARAASCAKVTASEAYTRVAREALHAHGAIGFTWEHDAQIFLKRSVTDRSLLGTPAEHRRLLANALDAAVPERTTFFNQRNED